MDKISTPLPAARSNVVVSLRVAFLPRHRAVLQRWLEAGQRMGLCDADVCPPCAEVPTEHALIWVRENADPAYSVRAQGMSWLLVDQLRENELGRYASFEAALNAIRPVLPLQEIVAA